MTAKSISPLKKLDGAERVGDLVAAYRGGDRAKLAGVLQHLINGLEQEAAVSEYGGERALACSPPSSLESNVDRFSMGCDAGVMPAARAAPASPRSIGTKPQAQSPHRLSSELQSIRRALSSGAAHTPNGRGDAAPAGAAAAAPVAPDPRHVALHRTNLALRDQLDAVHRQLAKGGTVWEAQVWCASVAVLWRHGHRCLNCGL